MKVLYLPMDSRPLCYGNVQRCISILPIPVLLPNRGEIGSRSRGAELERLCQWLEYNSESGDVIVLSVDALFFGGLVQARSVPDPGERVDKALQFLRTLKSKIGRGGKILAFFVWKRVWGNIFEEHEIDKVEEYKKLSYAIISEVQKQGKDVFNYLRLLSKGAQLADWMDKAKVMEFARSRLSQRRITLLLLETLGDCIDFLHIAREDNEPRGLTALEIASLREEARRMGASFTSAEGGDEAGMLLLARAINLLPTKALQHIMCEMADKGNLQRTPTYEGVKFEETLHNFIDISQIGASAVGKLGGAYLTILLDGTIRQGDPLLAFARTAPDVPNPDFVLNQIVPCKRISRLNIKCDLSTINGVNFELVEWLARADTLPLLTTQSATIANRLGHALFLASVFRHGLEKKIPEPGTWRTLARIALATYLEEVLYCGYLRSWAMQKFGGLQPQDAGTQALAEVEMSNFLREFARKKFNGAEFLERKIDVLEVRLRLPWNRWFEAEVDVNVVPK